MAGYNIPPLSALIDAFSKLPGIGRKSAARLAFHTLRMSNNDADNFISAIKNAREHLHFCPVCQKLTDQKICNMCSSDQRDKSVICVVESAQDVMVLEKTRDYKGLYHVLHGVLSPIDGIGPEQLKIKELISRVADDGVKEVIMATNPSVEGETTSSYISRLLKPMGITVTRLGFGIPVNGSLEYTDSVTLSKALEGRKEI